MRPNACKKLIFPTLLSYTALCFFLAGGHGGNSSCFEVYCSIFGGISAGILSDNLMKLMQWLLSFLPLLLFLGIQFSQELSGRLYVTIIRSRSIRGWWNSWVLFSLFTAVMFSVCVFMAGSIVSIVFGDVNGFLLELGKFLSLFCITAIYNSMLSVFLVSLGVWLRNLKWSMLLLLVIIMASYVLGKFFPESNPYLVGTYSMANRLQENDSLYGVPSAVAVLLMLLLGGAAYLTGLWGAGKVLYKRND